MSPHLHWYKYDIDVWPIRMICSFLTQQKIKIPRLKRGCSTGSLSGVSLFFHAVLLTVPTTMGLELFLSCT